VVNIEDREIDILSRYPGNSPRIREHIRRAVEQLNEGETIGRRGTPVVSFWLMRDKWRDRGASWEQQGWDGDIEYFSDDVARWRCPAALRLVYFKTYEGLVCQLAYVIQQEYISSIVVSPAMTTLPNIIEDKYYGHFGVPSRTEDKEQKTPDILIMDTMDQVYGR